MDPYDPRVELVAAEINNGMELVIEDVVVDRSFALVEHKKRKANSSPVWLFVREVTTPAKNRYDTLCDHACSICAEGACQWKDCLIKIHNNNPSNGAAHLNSHHPVNEDWLAARKLKDDPSISNGDTKRPPLNVMERSLFKGRAEALLLVHENVMNFIVNAGLPTSMYAHPDLNKLLMSATMLNPGQYKVVSRHQSEQVVIRFFQRFVTAVSADIDRVRKLYLDGVKVDHEGNFSAKFICVHHDGWDGDTKSLLGVSITYSDPKHFQVRRAALGLVHTDSHGSEHVADAVFRVLLRFGITPSDVFASVNDTANSAVAAGRLIAADDNNTPTCKMHTMSLVYSHAIGKVTRTMNRVVVDSFPDGERLRLKMHKLFSFVWNKRAKKRAVSYRMRNHAVGHKTVRCPIDNATRINGTHRMYEFALRSRFCIDIYLNAEVVSVREAHTISEIDWQLIAELEAVMRSTAEYSIKVQTERNTSMSMSYIWSLKVRFGTLQVSTFSVVDLDKGSHLETPGTLANGWDSKTLFKDLPTKIMTASPEESRLKGYPMISPLAIMLLTRLRLEFDKYFPPPEDAELIAMACNPIMITIGKKILLKKPDQADLWAQAITLLRSALAGGGGSHSCPIEPNDGA